MDDDETRKIKSSGVTQNQLSKFRELQRRRLQLTSKPVNKKKRRASSGAKTKLQCEDVKGCVDGNEDHGLNESIICGSSSEGNEKNNELSSLNHEVDTHPALRKKKLHWGLDTKERWERKANM